MPRSLELFAGGGGMALGLHAAGFSHAALVELDHRACETLRRNAGVRRAWLRDSVIEADVAAHLTTLRTSAGTLGEIDIIAGGPPCQPFSLGGVHAGMNDQRNLFPVALDYVRELRPKAVIFENVPGLLRPSFLPYFTYVEQQLRFPTVTPRHEEPWQEHAARLDTPPRRPSLRYKVHRQIINAADLGAPQARRRVFLMAVRDDIAGAEPMVDVPMTHDRDALLYAQWVEPSYWEEHGLSEPEPPDSLSQDRLLEIKRAAVDQGLLRWRTVRDALDGLPEPIDHEPHTRIANHIGIPGARAYVGHTGSDVDWPSKTLKAGVHGVCGGEAMIRYRDGRLRYMSVREAARIQCFPDSYVFEGARSHAMRQIGNAVVVRVATAVARHLTTRFPAIVQASAR